MTSRKQAASAADLYNPIEQAIIADYLNIKRPRAARCMDIKSDEELEQEDNSADTVRLRLDIWGNVGQFTIPNAVARLMLNAVQYRLPQWAVADGEGNVRMAREYNSRQSRYFPSTCSKSTGQTQAPGSPGLRSTL